MQSCLEYFTPLDRDTARDVGSVFSTNVKPTPVYKSNLHVNSSVYTGTNQNLPVTK